MENLSSFQYICALFILSIGHFMGGVIVCNYIYLPWKRRLELEDIEVIPKYEEKFLIETVNDTFMKPEDVSNDVYVTEETPEGYVIMRYNNNEEGFEYWSDNSNIKYDYLEVVSRKYVSRLSCKNLYKNRKPVVEEMAEEVVEEVVEEMVEEMVEEVVEEEEDIFIKPKIISTDENSKKQVRKISNIKGNKYIRKGKICDLDIFKLKKNTKNPPKKLSFNDYKRLMKTNN